MDKRKQIALFLFYDETWIAGAYYIINLISSLRLLPDNEQPHLTIVGKTFQDIEKAKEIKYPYVDFRLVKDYRHNFVRRGIRVTIRKLTGKEVFKPTIEGEYPKHFFDAIFPAPILFEGKITKKTIYWIPDFQEEHLPQFFTAADISFRKRSQNQIASSGETVVFSSRDAYKDFLKLYPQNNTATAVLNFSVTHPLNKEIGFDSLRSKYNLPAEYFFCPNQFWAHKNHKIVLEAIGKLRDVYKQNIQVVFSGKELDYRNPRYIDEVNSIIDLFNIGKNISRLGFIDRNDQLAIMKNAQAVIQPSYFEGWSTVVEDAKSMNQNLIVSDIAVHREQLGNSASFFDPYSVDSLVEAITRFKKSAVDFNYNLAQINFGRNFLKIVAG